MSSSGTYSSALKVVSFLVVTVAYSILEYSEGTIISYPTPTSTARLQGVTGISIKSAMQL